MLRAKDYVLLLVVYASILAAVLFPDLGEPFRPYPQHLLMLVFFLSFLTVRLDEIGSVLKRSPGAVVLFTLFKLILLPAAVYGLFLVLAPAMPCRRSSWPPSPRGSRPPLSRTWWEETAPW
jgi:predicted Na+-dependent transporter